MLKAKETGLTKNWTVVARQGAAYTGGPLSVARRGSVVACLCNERAALLDLGTGAVVKFFPPEGVEEPICSFVLAPDGNCLVTCGRNLMLRKWDVSSGLCAKAWKGHKSPVSCTAVDPSGTLMATGATDRCVMVWDLDHGHATHAFKGHSAIVCVVAFVPHPDSAQRLVSACEAGELRVWDLITSTAIAVMSEHGSAVTSIAFSPDPSGHTMLTSGRDSLINLWDTRDWDAAAAAAAAGGDAGPVVVASCAQVAAKETIEGLVVLPPFPHAAAATDRPAPPGCAASGEDFQFATAGAGGVLRLWRTTVRGKDRASRRFGCGVVAGRSMQHLRDQLTALDGAPLDAGGCSALLTAAAAASDPAAAAVSAQFCVLHIIPGLDLTSGKSAAPAWQLLVASRDQVISIVSATLSLDHVKTIVGNSDEIIDVKYIPAPLPLPSDMPSAARDAFTLHPALARCTLAVATNSEHIALVERDTFDARLCCGHTSVVLSVAVSPDGTLIASASKDRTARVWDVATGACLVEAVGHTESVTAVAWPVRPAQFMHASPVSSGAAPTAAVIGSQAWLATASKDRTLKLWALGPLLSKLPSPRPSTWLRSHAVAAAGATGGSCFRPSSIAAVVAHEKDINALVVAPNDALCASGSQDKTVKLWALPDLAPVATLRGHRRGVWAVAFSPTDRVLVSASGDRSVRLWSVAPHSGFACLRTLEGHEASVLTVAFLPRGLQLVTAGADGLCKLWNIADGSVVNTFDAHTEKVWALAVRPAAGTAAAAPAEESGGQAAPGVLELVTGGSDSVLNVWHDVTAQEAAVEMLATEATLMKQQRLFGAMAMRDYAGALTLALELQQPGRFCDILSELLEAGPTPRTSGLTPQQEEARYAAAMRAEITEMRAEDAGGTGVCLNSAAARRRGADLFAAFLRSAPLAETGRLLGYLREWNTQSRHGLVAQRALGIVMRTLPRQALAEALFAARAAESVTQILPGVGAVAISPEAPAGGGAAFPPLPHAGVGVGDEVDKSRGIPAAANEELKSLVGALLPYSERHFDRVDRLAISSYAVDSVLAAMHVLEPLGGGDRGEFAAATDDLNVLRRRDSDAKRRRAHDESGDDSDTSFQGVDGAVRGGGWLRGATSAVNPGSASETTGGGSVSASTRGAGEPLACSGAAPIRRTARASARAAGSAPAGASSGK